MGNDSKKDAKEREDRRGRSRRRRGDDERKDRREKERAKPSKDDNKRAPKDAGKRTRDKRDADNKKARLTPNDSSRERHNKKDASPESNAQEEASESSEKVQDEVVEPGNDIEEIAVEDPPVETPTAPAGVTTPAVPDVVFVPEAPPRWCQPGHKPEDGRSRRSERSRSRRRRSRDGSVKPPEPKEPPRRLASVVRSEDEKYGKSKCDICHRTVGGGISGSWSHRRSPYHLACWMYATGDKRPWKEIQKGAETWSNYLFQMKGTGPGSIKDKGWKAWEGDDQEGSKKDKTAKKKESSPPPIRAKGPEDHGPKRDPPGPDPEGPSGHGSLLLSMWQATLKELSSK